MGETRLPQGLCLLERQVRTTDIFLWSARGEKDIIPLRQSSRRRFAEKLAWKS